jgi:flagellar motor protein MotB
MQGLSSIDELAAQGLRHKRSGGGPWYLIVLLLGVLAGGAYLAWQQYERFDRELASAAKARDAAKQAAVDADAAAKKAHDDLKVAEQKLSELAAEVAHKSNEGETNERLIADLRGKLDAKEGEVSAEANHVTVNLVDQVLFKSGEADLSPRGKDVLGKVAGVLKALSDKEIVIGGHTDDRPIHSERFPSNWELSAARAVNVVHYLIDAGVDPRHLTAAAYSEFHPRGRHKSKNRRIEILLSPIVQVKKAKDLPKPVPAAKEESKAKPPAKDEQKGKH